MAGDQRLEIGDLPPYAPQKLYFTVFSRRFLRAAVRVLSLIGQDPHHFGKNKDVDLTSLVEVDYPTHTRISIRDVMRQKERATACHSSQIEGMGGPGVRVFMRLFAGDETFMRAVPAEPPQQTERDLFEGVDAAPRANSRRF